jgi:paraquat-inducible protein B
MAGCSSDQVHEKLQRSGEKVQEKLEPTERALQPTVSAFECGGGSVSAAISACRAEGGHTGHCAVVAANAGVSGATACYSYATQIKKRRQQLVGQEDQLDAHIRYLQDVNQDTEVLNNELSGKIVEVTARTDTAVDSLAKGEMTQAELNQLRAILDHELTAAQRQLDTMSRELQAAQQYRARQSPEAARLDDEIARLQELLNQAQRDTGALALQRQRI